MPNILCFQNGYGKIWKRSCNVLDYPNNYLIIECPNKPDNPTYCIIDDNEPSGWRLMTENEIKFLNFNRENKIAELKSRINNVTDNKITNEFYFRGIHLSLTQEDQINFSGLEYLSRENLLEYPRTVWGNGNVVSLESREDVLEFYLTGVAHKQSYLDAGKKLKDNLELLSNEELLDWTDPRS